MDFGPAGEVETCRQVTATVRLAVFLGSTPATSSAAGQVPKNFRPAATSDCGCVDRAPRGSLRRARTRIPSITRSRVHVTPRRNLVGSTPAANTALDHDPKHPWHTFQLPEALAP